MNFLVFLMLLNLDVKIVDVPKALQYHTKMADFYYHKGNYPEMLFHLSRKIHYDKKDVNTWSDLAYYYWSMSVDDKVRKEEFKNKAFKYLFEGLEFNKESAYLWDEIGRFYILSNDWNSALKYFETAVTKKDCQDITYHFLSQCYLKLGETNKAISALEQCIKKFPNDVKAKSNLKKLQKDLTGG
jgi:tetratricopeptide (TPR) repeat protein